MVVPEASVENGKQLADIIISNSWDEWQGAALADAMAKALERMPLTPEQLAIFIDELAKHSAKFEIPSSTPSNAPSM